MYQVYQVYLVGFGMVGPDLGGFELVRAQALMWHSCVSSWWQVLWDTWWGHCWVNWWRKEDEEQVAVSGSAAHLCPPLPTFGHLWPLCHAWELLQHCGSWTNSSGHLCPPGRCPPWPPSRCQGSSSGGENFSHKSSANWSRSQPFTVLAGVGFSIPCQVWVWYLSPSGPLLIPDVRSKFRRTLFPGRITWDLRLKTVWARTYNLCQTALALCSNFHPPRQLIQN